MSQSSRTIIKTKEDLDKHMMGEVCKSILAFVDELELDPVAVAIVDQKDLEEEDGD